MNDPFEEMENALARYEQVPHLQVPVIALPPKPLWLYDFSREICGHDLLCPQPHYEFVNLVEKYVGDCQFNASKKRTAVMIQLPRGVYKSTIVAEDTPTGIIVKNPNIRMLITTHKDVVSSRRLNAIKFNFEKNKAFQEKYGDDWKPQFRNGLWNQSSFVVARRKIGNLREPTVEVGAVSSDKTGAHYNVIIADDVVQLENSRNAEQRDKVFEYIDSLFALLDPGGLLFVICTRWHTDDAYGRIEARDRERIRAGEEPIFTIFKKSCYDGPNGLYFPTEYGFAELEDLKLGRHFAANYLNKPVADEDLVFKPEYAQVREFSYMLQGSRKGGLIRCEDAQIPVDVIMMWDTAGTRATNKSDFHGITCKGTDYQGRDWVLVAEEYKGTVSQVVQRIVSHIAVLRPRAIIIEAIGSFEHWTKELNQALERDGLSICVIEAKHGGIPKAERIAMLEPKWTSKRIILQKHHLAFRKQLDNFSMDNNLTHDDILDSFAMGEGHSLIPDEIESTDRVSAYDEEYRERQKAHGPRNILGYLRKRRWGR